MTTLAEYNEDWDYPVVLPARAPGNDAGRDARRARHRAAARRRDREVRARDLLLQRRRGHPYPGEERYLCRLTGDVPTYDFKPEMSAEAAADAFAEHWKSGSRFGIINFANPDMVGHNPARSPRRSRPSRRWTRAPQAGRGGPFDRRALLITADHGNADHMLEADGSPNTQHSLNPMVPVIVTAEVGGPAGRRPPSDVAPTLLELLGQDQPEAMTGSSLIERPSGRLNRQVSLNQGSDPLT